MGLASTTGSAPSTRTVAPRARVVELRRHPLDDRAEVDVFALKVDAPDARELEQVPQEPLHFVRVDRDAVDVATGRWIERVAVVPDDGVGHPLDREEGSLEVVRHGVDERLLLTRLGAQSILGALAFDGVAEGADEEVALDAALDEVVLGAGADAGDGEVLVVGAAHDNDGDAGGGGVDAGDEVEAVAVGEGEIEEDDVGARVPSSGSGPGPGFGPRCVTQEGEGVGEAGDVADAEGGGVGGGEHEGDEARVRRVVLHHQDRDRVHVSLPACAYASGRVTVVSQKSSIPRTTVKNCSRSTGLAM